MKKFLAAAGIIVILAGIAFVLEKGRGRELQGGETGRVMSVEDYFKMNISTLSPEKEVLGGKFYVTKFQARDGRGTVEYEDGHNAYVADFTYSTDAEHGAISVDTFEIRQ